MPLAQAPIRSPRPAAHAQATPPASGPTDPGQDSNIASVDGGSHPSERRRPHPHLTVDGMLHEPRRGEKDAGRPGRKLLTCRAQPSAIETLSQPLQRGTGGRWGSLRLTLSSFGPPLPRGLGCTSRILPIYWQPSVILHKVSELVMLVVAASYCAERRPVFIAE